MTIDLTASAHSGASDSSALEASREHWRSDPEDPWCRPYEDSRRHTARPNDFEFTGPRSGSGAMRG